MSVVRESGSPRRSAFVRATILERSAGHVLDDVDALDRAAGLARVHERAPDEPRGRPVEIRVGRDDGRVLAAELEDDAREVLRRALHDLDAGLRRSP